MAINQDNPPAVDPNAPMNMGFGLSILNGHTEGDLYNFALSGDRVAFETPDEWNSYFENSKSELETDEQRDQFQADIDEQYNVLSKRWDQYNNFEFDPTDISVSLMPKSTADYLDNPPPKRFIQQDVPWERFSYDGQAQTAADWISLTGEKVQLEDAQQIAKQNAIYRNKEGQIMPYSLYSSSDNSLEERWDEKLKTNIWTEIGDNVIADPEHIKRKDWLGGAITLKSRWYEPAASGFVSGGISHSAYGIGGALEIMNDAYAHIKSVHTGRDFNEIAENTLFNDWATDMYNQGAELNRMNGDMKKGAFEGVNSFIYQFTNGLGQLVPQVAMGYGAGAMGAAKWVAGVAGKSLGSGTVIGLTSSELERLGFARSESAGLSFWLGAATYASESFMPQNVTQTLGWSHAKKMLNKADDRAIAEMAEALTEGTTKKQVFSNIKKRIGATGKDIAKDEGNRMIKLFGTLRKKYLDLDLETGLGQRLLKGTAEEGFEETVEGGMHMAMNTFFNNSQLEIARGNFAMYSNTQVELDKEKGLYRVQYNNGEVEYMDVQKVASLKKTMEHTKKVLNGESLVDANFTWDESAIAAMVGGVAGGLHAHQNYKESDMQRQKFFAAAIEKKENPSSFQKFEDAANKWVSDGYMTKDEASQWLTGIEQSMDLIIEQTKAMGLADPEKLGAIGEDKTLLYEVYKNLDDKNELLNIRAELEEAADDKAKQAAVIEKHKNNLLIEENSTVESVSATIKQIETQVENIFKPKMDDQGKPMVYEVNGKQVTAERSERYTERLFNAYAADVLVSNLAKEELADDKNLWHRFYEAATNDKNKVEEQRLKWLDKRKEKLWKQSNKIRTLMWNNKNYFTGYEFLKDVVGKDINAQVEYVNDLITARKEDGLLGTEGIDSMTGGIKSVNDIMDNTKTKVTKKEKGAEGQETEVEKEFTLREVMDVIRNDKLSVEERQEMIDVFKSSKTFQDAFSKNIMPALSQLSQQFDERKAKYQADHAQFFDQVKQLSVAAIDFENEYISTTGDVPEFYMEDEFQKDDAKVVNAVNNKFKNLSKDDFGAAQQQGGTGVGDLNRDIIKEELLKQVDGHPELTSLFTKAFENGETSALFELFSQMITTAGVKTSDSVGGKTLPFADLLSSFQKLFSSPNAKIEDIDTVNDMIFKMRFMADSLDKLVGLGHEATIKNLEKEPGMEEHSVYNIPGNGDKRMNDADAKGLKDLASILRNTATAWATDQRMKEGSTDVHRFKIRAAHIANKRAGFKYIYQHVRLDEDSKVKHDNNVSLTKAQQKVVLDEFAAIDKLISDLTPNIKSEVKEGMTVDITPEILAKMYRVIPSTDKAARQKVMDIATEIESRLDTIEAQFSGKLGKKFIPWMINTRTKITRSKKPFVESLDGDEIFSMSSVKIDGAYSMQEFNTGKTAWEKTSTAGNKINYPQEREFGFFFSTVLNTAIMADTFSPEYSKKQALTDVKRIIEATKGEKDHLSTWEQQNLLLETMAFMISDLPHTSDKTFHNELIKNSFYVRGYAGAGKSDIASVQAVMGLALRNRKKNKDAITQVTVVVPTPSLMEEYEKRGDNINKLVRRILGLKSEDADPIKFDLIATHDLKVDPKLYKDKDLIIVEELSMYSEREDGDLLRLQAIQNEYGSKMMLIGDNGQVSPLEQGKTEWFKTAGISSSILTEIHRTGIPYLYSLQEAFRTSPGIVMGTDQLPTATWSFDKTGNYGLRYIDGDNKSDAIIKNFIKAKKAGRNSVLILPTYDAREALMTGGKYGKDLELYADHVMVLEYDSKKIEGNKDLYKYNVAGSQFNEVYIPFSAEELVKGATGLFPSVYDTDIYKDINASRMMLSAVSRSKRYVEMGGDSSRSEALEEGATVQGYNTDPELSIEQQLEITDKAKDERIAELNKRIGEKKADDVVDDDTDVVDDDKVDENDKEEDGKDDGKNEEEVVITDPIYSRNTDVAKVTSKMINASKEIDKLKVRHSTITDIKDAIYEKAGIKGENEYIHARNDVITQAFKISSKNTVTTEDLDLYDALFERLWTAYQHHTTDTDLLEKQKVGLRNYFLDVTSELAISKELKAENLTSVDVGLQVNNLQGSPLAVKVVGIAPNGKPIVDVYHLRVTENQFNNIDEFDSKGINRDMLGTYGIMLKSLGYEINQLHLLQINDMFRTKEAIFTGPSFILSEEDAVDAMGKARTKLGITSETSVLTTVDDLYTMEREVSTTKFDGELIEIDDFLLTKSGKASQIEQIYQKFQGGKWKLRFKVAEDPKIYSEAQFRAKFNIPSIGTSERHYKSNANNFKQQEPSVFSSTMVMPASVDLESFPAEFFSDENEWLKKKEMASKAAEKLESIDKVFYQNFKAHKIRDRKGNIDQSVDIPYAIVNRVPEAQMETFAKMLKMSVSDVKKMGLDVLSIDGEPEIGFLRQKDTGEILATENKLAEKHPKEFQAYIDSNDIESPEFLTLKTMIEESFADETDDSTRQNLIDFNLYKLKTIWLGNQMAIEQGDSESIIIDPDGGVQAAQPRTKRYTKNPISFGTLTTNMENDGYRFTGRFEWGKERRKEKSGEFVKIFRPVYALFENKQTGDTVRIELNGKKIRGKENMEITGKEAVDELRDESKQLDSLIKRMDQLLQEKRMNDFTKDDWTRYNQLKLEIAPLLGETIAYSLIKNNREELKRRMNRHGDDVLGQWLDITREGDDGRYNLNVSGVNPERRRAGLIRLMGYFTELYKADKDFSLYMSPFKKAVDAKVTINTDNLETYTEGMNQPQLHLHPIGDTWFDAYKSKPAENKTDNQGETEIDTDEMYDNATSDSNLSNFSFIAEEQALEELVDLLGHGILESLQIDRNEIIRNGKMSFGSMRQGIIHLTSFGGNVEKSTPRHEAMHFIFQYFTDQKTKDRIIKEVKQRAGKPDMTYRDVHEWLADNFGNKTYNKMTFMGKVIDFFKRILRAFGVAQNISDVDRLFAQADSGKFRNRHANPDLESLEVFHNKVENDLNSLDAIKGIEHLFGNWAMAEEQTIQALVPNILKKSKYGKFATTTGTLTQRTIDSNQHFSDAVGEVGQMMRQAHRTSMEKNETISYKGENNEDKEVTYQNLTKKEFDEAYTNKVRKGQSETQLRLNNQKLMRKYFQKTIAAGGGYLADDGFEKVMDGERVFQALVQDQFPNIDIQSIVYGSGKEGAVKVFSKNAAVDKSTVNPAKSMSSFFRSIIQTIPYLGYSTSSGSETETRQQGMTINSRNAEGILREVAERMRVNPQVNMHTMTKETTRNGRTIVIRGLADVFFDELRTYRDKLPNDNNDAKALVHSILVYFGNEVAVDPSNRIRVTKQGATLNGIGYLKIIKGKKGDLRRLDNRITPEQEAEIYRHKRYYSWILNGVINHVAGLRKTQRAYIESGPSGINAKRKNEVSKNSTMIKVALQESARQHFFVTGNGLMKKSKIDMFHPDLGTHKYEIRDDGLYIKAGNKWTHIVKAQDGNYGFGDITDATLDEHLKTMYNDLFPGNDIGKKSVTSMRKRETVIGDVAYNFPQIAYHMIQGLVATAINSKGQTDAGVDVAFEGTARSKELADSWYSGVGSMEGVDIVPRQKLDLAFPILGHDLFFSFIQDMLGEALAVQRGNLGTTLMWDVNGNKVWSFQDQSTLSTMFPNSSPGNPSNVIMGNEVKAQIKDEIKRRKDAGEAPYVQTPLFTMAEVDGELQEQYRNAFLNDHIRFTSIKEFDGEKSTYSTISREKMNTSQYIQQVHKLTRIALTENFGGGLKIPAILNPMADHAAMHLVEWESNFGDIIKVNKTNDGKKVSSVTWRAQNFVQLAQNNVEYAFARREQTLQRWEALTGGAPVTAKVKVSDIKGDLRDYDSRSDFNQEGDHIVIGQGWEQANNPYIKVDYDAFNGAIASQDWVAAMDIVKKAHEKDFGALIDQLSDTPKESVGRGGKSPEMLIDESLLYVKEVEANPNPLQQALEEIGLTSEELNQITDDIGRLAWEGMDFNTASKLFGQLTGIIGSAQKQAKKLDGYNAKDWNPVWAAKEKLEGIVHGKTKAKNLKDLKSTTKESLALAEVMYWSHDFINQAMNQSTRGDVTSYEGIIDYVKRGQGVDGKGSGYNTANIGMTMNVASINDPMIRDSLFTKDTMKDLAAFDGVRWTSPVLHDLQMVDKGGELGNISYSAQKNMHFYYDVIKDKVIYFKMSDVPINHSLAQEPEFKNMLKLMVGDHYWNIYKDQLTSPNKIDFDTAIRAISDEVLEEFRNFDGVSDKFNGMIHVFANETTQKGTPSGTTLEYEEKDGSYVVPDTIDPKDITTITSTDLKLQQVSGGFVFDKERGVLTQINTILGAGSWNNEIANTVNEALQTRAEVAIEELSAFLDPDDTTFRQNIIDRGNLRRGSEKVARAVANPDININVFKGKATQSTLGTLDDGLKPKVPGTSLIQTPSPITYFEKNGVLYKRAELAAHGIINPDDSTELETAGFTKRKMKPIRFFRKDTGIEIRSREELQTESEADNVKFVPQEIAAPMLFKKEFDLWSGSQPGTIFQVGNTTYRTSIEEEHDSVENIFSDLQQFEKDDAGQFLGQFDENVLNWVGQNFFLNADNQGLSEQDTPKRIARKQKREMKKYLMEKVDTPEGRREFLQGAATFFFSLNRAMDIFPVRIPTTNASSGFPSRIVEFVWDYDSTAFVPAEKNILDGSDFDIDELHAILRSVSGKDFQLAADIFDSSWEYYKDPKNAMFIVQTVGTERIEELGVKYAEEKDPTRSVTSVLTAAEEKHVNMAGKELVGHFANLMTAAMKIMHMPVNKRIQIFENLPKGVPSLREGDTALISPFLSDSRDSLLNMMDDISVLINASTDNAKLGGLLGRLGINTRTSGLISGLLMMGYTLEEGIGIVNSEDVKAFITENRHVKKPLWDQIKIDKDSSDTMKVAAKAFLIGEQLRRTTEFVRLQGGSKANMFWLYNYHKNTDAYLNEGDTAELTSQTYSLNALLEPDAIPLLQTYKDAVDQAYNTITSKFISTTETKLFKEVIDQGKYKEDNVYDEREFNSIMREMDSMIEGRYISSMGEVTLSLGNKNNGDIRTDTYNMANVRDRMRFIEDFKDFIIYAKAHGEVNQDGGSSGNLFLSKLTPRMNENVTMYQFSDGNYMEAREKTQAISSFSQLPTDVKDAFRTYQMLVFGMGTSQGSFWEVMDDGLENDYSDYLNENENALKEIVNDPKQFKEIAARLPEIQGSNADLSKYTSQVNAYGEFGAIEKVGDNQWLPLNMPFMKNVNLYGDHSTTTNLYTTRAFDIDQKYTEEGETISTPFGAKGAFGSTSNAGTAGYGATGTPVSGIPYETPTQAITQRGDMVEITFNVGKDPLTGKNKYRTHVKLIEKNYLWNQESKGDKRVQESRVVMDSAITGDVLNNIITMVRTAFPGIELQTVNDASALRPGKPGYTVDGIVYINTDHVGTDTPFHEYGHIYMGIAKAVNPKLYNQLISEAQRLVESGDKIATGIYNLYPDLQEQDRLEEIAVGLVGIQSAQMAQGKYATALEPNYKNKGRGLWNRIKNLLSGLRRMMTGVLNSIFGTKTLSQVNSISDLAKQLTSGKPLSHITSKQWQKLVEATKVRESRVTTVSNFSEMFDRMTNPQNREDVEKLRDYAIATQLINEIERHQGTLPAYVLGEKLKIAGWQILEPNSSTIKTLVEEFKKKDVIVFNRMGKILTELNTPNGFFRNANPQAYLDDIFDGDSIVTVDHMHTLLRSIDHFKDRTYMSLADFNIKYNTGVADTDLENSNIIVAVDFSDENEVMASYYDLTNFRSSSTWFNDGKQNILTGFVDEKTAKRAGVTSTNDNIGLKRMALGYLSVMSMKNNSKIKVQNIGVIAPLNKKKPYYAIDMARQMLEMKAMASLEEFQGQVDKKIVNALANSTPPPFNYAKYYDTLYYGDTDRKFNELSLKEQIDYLKRRLQEITLTINDKGELGYNDSAEARSIIETIDVLLNENAITWEVLVDQKIGNITRYLFDQNAIGERNFNLARQAIMDSENRVVKESEKVQEKFAAIHKKMLAISGVSIAQRSLVNSSKQVWGDLMHTTKAKIGDQETDVYTGMIYWTDNENEAVGQGAKKVARDAKERGISPAILEIGKEYVELVDELMVLMVQHKEYIRTGKDVTADEARKMLKENSSYSKGFIPVMNALSSELFSRGQIKASVEKTRKDMFRSSLLMTEQTTFNDVKQDQDFITEIADNMFQQIGYGQENIDGTDFGSGTRMRDRLGLEKVMLADGTIGWKNVNGREDWNANISFDLETIFDYLNLSIHRVKHYEQEALPVVNAIKHGLLMAKKYKGLDVVDTIKHIDDYVDAAVLNIRKDKGDETQIGPLKPLKVLEATNRIVRPIIMLGNFNIAVVSATSNFLAASTEALANSLVDTGYFGLKELSQASAMYWSNKKLADAMMRHYGVFVQSEYDLLHHRKHKTVEKTILSDYYANLPNYVTDHYARAVVMMAQMLKDGSFKAHSLDSEGNVKYNIKQDSRFYGATDAKEKEKQKVLRTKHNDLLELQGPDKDSRGYDNRAARTFKVLADKYVVGSYTSDSRSVLNNYTLGRAALMFSNWFIGRFSNAFSTSKYSKEGGRLVVRDIDGKPVAKWEELFIEGYAHTAWRFMSYLARADMKAVRSMSLQEKRNVVKTGGIIGTWGLFYLMSKFLLSQKDDDDKPIPNMMLTRAIFNAANGLLVIDHVQERLGTAFPGPSILLNGFFTKYGVFSWSNLKNITPLSRTYDFLDEAQYPFTGDVLNETLSKER